RPTIDFWPTLSALASIFPLVPVERDTGFDTEESLRVMLAGRGPELDEIVLRHSAFLQCDVRAEFDASAVENEVAVTSPASNPHDLSESEQTLVQRTRAQSVAGRHAAFIARLRRCLTEVAADMVPVETRSSTPGLSRRVLLARSSRKNFKIAIAE